jgi:hypothetical protein
MKDPSKTNFSDQGFRSEIAILPAFGKDKG